MVGAREVVRFSGRVLPPDRPEMEEDMPLWPEYPVLPAMWADPTFWNTHADHPLWPYFVGVFDET